jgi:TonB family protein
MLHPFESSPGGHPGRRGKGRSASGLSASLVLHAGLIAGLVAITNTGEAHTADKPKDEHIVYTAPPPPPAPLRAPEPERPKPPTAKPKAPAAPKIAQAPRPPAPAPTPVKAEPAPVAPPVAVAATSAPVATVSVPTVAVPSVDLASKATSGIGFDSSKAVKTTTVASSGGEVERAVEPGHVYSEHTVDEAVQPLGSNPRPEYPTSLKSSGVEADFTVKFVVDSTGRVKTETVEIVGEPHSLFERAVRSALSRSRYRPARAAGHKVAQLVAQRFAFQLDR